jgi:hypothetical protein
LILAAGLIAGSILDVHIAATPPGALVGVPLLDATINLSRWRFVLGATIWAAAALMWSFVLQGLVLGNFELIAPGAMPPAMLLIVGILAANSPQQRV